METSSKREWISTRLGGLLLLLLLVILNACGDATPDAAQAILGQWQRVSPAGPGDPNELSAEYLEFRENGVLLTLIKNEDADTFWLNNSATYTVTSSSQMQVVGSCWQGWERYTCSRTYRLRLAGDELRISADNQAEYRRIGELSPDLPPTLAPPFPSPTLRPNLLDTQLPTQAAILVPMPTATIPAPAPTTTLDQAALAPTVQPSAVASPQTSQVRWDTSPTALVIRYYTGPGIGATYDPNYYIPEVQIWGDGRIIWVEGGRPHESRQILEGRLTTDQLKSLLQRIIEAGFFGWQEKYGLGGSTHSPGRLLVNLIGQSKEVIAYDLAAPSAYFELIAFLQGGAGATGSDFIPMRGYLTAQCWPPIEGITLPALWPDVTAGFTLGQVGDGRYIEGEPLAFAWQTVNKAATAPVYVKSNDQTCVIMVQIPGVSFYEPPP